MWCLFLVSIECVLTVGCLFKSKKQDHRRVKTDGWSFKCESSYAMSVCYTAFVKYPSNELAFLTSFDY